MEKKIGSWSFIIGVIIALILGLASSALPGATPTILVSIMVILGLIVGLINVAGKETKDFLLSAAVLIIAVYMGSASSTLGAVELIGPYLSSVFTQLLAFVVPVTIVVALKEIYYIAQSP